MWERGEIVGARGRNVGSVKWKENLEGGSRMDIRKGGRMGMADDESGREDWREREREID